MPRQAFSKEQVSVHKHESYVRDSCLPAVHATGDRICVRLLLGPISRCCIAWMALSTISMLTGIGHTQSQTAVSASSTVSSSSGESSVQGESGTVALQGTGSADEFRVERIRGRVVWLATALKDRFGISTVPEVSTNNLALLSEDGELIPLVENVRARAFRKDKRLVEMDLELVVRRYQRQPFVPILRIYQLENGHRFEIDYWCDVCAIPMYESGPCSCCQDHNRLRKQEATEEFDESDIPIRP
ncbi:MAG: hypothetical protein KDB22_06390 [Planctomycetales bacterium]|nr:hypothetical protein [Planctomycetales bacterium]